MLASVSVHSDVRAARVVYADTCSFALTALSPNNNLWDAIPRDIDAMRYSRADDIQQYCEQLASDASDFCASVRVLLKEQKLIVLDAIRQEVQGQRGRTNGLALRAEHRFSFAPTPLVQQSLQFQVAAHDAGLAAPQPKIEKKLVSEVMRRLSTFWHELRARTGEGGVSSNDKLLFAAAAVNAIMIENGYDDYGTVVLVSRDLNHVFRMYRSREDILRPVCKKLRLLYPRNFLFRPTFQDIEARVSVQNIMPR